MRVRFALLILACVVAAPLSAPPLSAASPTGVSTPACKTAGLVIWIPDGRGNGTAGSIYYRLEFTNLSGRTCTLSGFPTAVAIGLNGRRLGQQAKLESAQKPGLVKLVAGGSAAAQLRIVEAGAIRAASCDPAMAAGLSVSPPGQSSSRSVPLPFEACARGTSVLSVGPFKLAN
ncbi:MAG: DUF4232 domain-containing protein [Solirubrobacterales bacterium]